jgi:short-subunit dehydrogenase
VKELRGANAILTGASRGLGVHIARALAARGVNLALAARNQPQLDDVRDETAAMGVKAVAIATDVTAADQRDELVRRAAGELGPIDVLVNNAGIESVSRFERSDPAEIDAIIALNLTSVLLLTRSVLPGMLDRGRGHVVNMASLAGKSGTPYEVAYSASKWGLVGATHALRAEYVDTPIGFSVVCPGFVRDDGMYARWEAADIAAPRALGTTSPAKVAAAVVDAIVHDRAEILVNDIPMRAALTFGAALPGLAPRVTKLLGVTDMMCRAADLGSPERA